MSAVYLVEIRGPVVLEVGVAATATVRVEGPTGYVVPSAATCTVYDGPDTTTPKGTGTVSIAADGTVSAALDDTLTSGEDPASTWWLLWSLTVAGETVRQPQRIILGPYKLNCPVTTAILLEREPTFADGIPDGQTTWHPQIRAAWEWTLTRLLAEERDPHKVRNSDGLAPVVTAKSLQFAAELQATYVPDGSRLVAKAAAFADETEREWSRMRLDTDTDGDGDVDLDHAPPPNPSASTAELARRWFG